MVEEIHVCYRGRKTEVNWYKNFKLQLTGCCTECFLLPVILYYCLPSFFFLNSASIVDQRT
jgi:hypothetical protein